ncbi:outer membrane porin protein 32 precursor [mine drainage metagenome]|uniref:Outer membrane porin protein 32 n=1 Tax=mine drainage metagenome TaxID=410659 RepID=A0A1J5S2G2_9ZZZZ
MKKAIIALTVLGSVAGAAQAQSAVTVYGVVDAGLVHENNGSTSVISMDEISHSGNMSGSRLGFKGKEDLGGGLAAVFQLENGFNVDNGSQADSTRLFNRLAFVGLSGELGAIKLGRQKNPLYANNKTFDPFVGGLAGDYKCLFNSHGNRTDNLITYGYAADGLRGEVQYGLGQKTISAAANRTIAGFVGYRRGAIDLALTHQAIRNANDTSTNTMTVLGGNYNFGVVKAYASYAWEGGVVLNAATPLDQRDQREALVGLTMPISTAGTLITSYIRKTDKTLANADASQVAIGYKYKLSKRTTLYTSYGELRNDSQAKYGKVPVAGNTDTIYDVGINHSF